MSKQQTKDQELEALDEAIAGVREALAEFDSEDVVVMARRAAEEIERLRAALEWYGNSNVQWTHKVKDNGKRARRALRTAVETTPVQCKWIEVTHGQFAPGCGADRFTITWRDPLVKFCEYCGKPLQWPADARTDKTASGT